MQHAAQAWQASKSACSTHPALECKQTGTMQAAAPRHAASLRRSSQQAPHLGSVTWACHPLVYIIDSSTFCRCGPVQAWADAEQRCARMLEYAPAAHVCSSGHVGASAARLASAMSSSVMHGACSCPKHAACCSIWRAPTSPSSSQTTQRTPPLQTTLRLGPACMPRFCCHKEMHASPSPLLQLCFSRQEQQPCLLVRAGGDVWPRLRRW